jgi:translation initiation factor eIF-2B subunit epsilon
MSSNTINDSIHAEHTLTLVARCMDYTPCINDFPHLVSMTSHTVHQCPATPCDPLYPRSLSVGDAMREIHRMAVINSHFILVTGDVVSNFQLGSLLEEHK